MTEYAWFDKGDGRQVDRNVETGPAPKRSDLPTPVIITGTMDSLQHPCTGEMVISKSAFRALTKALGCIKVGTDPARHRPARSPNPIGRPSAIACLKPKRASAVFLECAP